MKILHALLRTQFVDLTLVNQLEKSGFFDSVNR